MEKPTLISLFTGAGGLDIGLEQAGFDVVAAVEKDADCVETLKVNQLKRLPIQGDETRVYLSGTSILCKSIEEIAASDLVPAGADSSWRPTLIAGGPPCQPFSSAGAQRSVNCPMGRLFEQFVRLVEEMQPKFILFENVRGLVTARGPSGQPGEVLFLIKEAFEELGYATSFALLNAADYGVPQKRVRLFMFGACETALPEFPSPTHVKAMDSPLFFSPWVSLGDFLRNSPPPQPDELIYPSPALAQQLSAVKDGSGLKSRGVAEPTRPGGHWGYKQGAFIANPAEPARTVTASSSQDWIRDPRYGLRRLSVRECAGLQGFPPGWAFCGKRASQYRQVGNAVVVPVARLLGRQILSVVNVPSLQGRPDSAPLPLYMKGAIAYTQKEDVRNGAVRVRSPHFKGASGCGK